MYTRARRIHSTLSDAMIRMAVEQFLPSIVAGLLLTMVVLGSVPNAAWMLPGIWQVVFSLGIFSSCRFLPKPMVVAGAWYLLTGLTCIAIGNVQAFSPFAMGIPFGIGQLLIAVILLFFASEAQGEG
jgi:predicted benzoate:H+ symporter BenE